MNKRCIQLLKLFMAASITAYLTSGDSARGQLHSGTVVITDREEGKKVTLYEESHALIIWAGNYLHWTKLENTEIEARQVEASLIRQGFEVTVEGNATGESLRAAVNKFISENGYKFQNRLVIFFAGHGHTRHNNKGYLVPIDAPDPNIDEKGFLDVAIPMVDILGWAKKIESKHVLFVFDSCFSGTLFETRSLLDLRNAYLLDTYIQTIRDKPVRLFITSGDADEEVPAKSVFTPLFIRGIEGEADYEKKIEGEADYKEKDGYVTGSELCLYLTQNLSIYTTNQSPQCGKIRDPELDRGDIVFRSQGSKPPTPPPPTPLSENFILLRDLLAERRWQEADELTKDKIFKLAGLSIYDPKDYQNIKNISCSHLIIIDKLWQENSEGKFGFSAQYEVYQPIYTLQFGHRRYP